MHLVVVNIPETLRTRDLRNFFSELIEKGAFICFHFRHRPQNQLVQLKDPEILSLPQSGPQDSGLSRVSGPLSTELGNDDVDGPSVLNRKVFYAENSKKTEDSKRLDCEEVSEPSSSAQDENENHGEQNTSVYSTRSRVNCKDSGLKSHWLNSGLSGLTMLIDDKKKKANTDWKHSLRASDNVTTPTCTKDKNSLDGAYDILSSESSKRTCCILNIKDSYVESFMLKYNKKHWVNAEGEILPPKCLILKMNLDKRSYKGEEYKTRGDLDSHSLSIDVSQDLIEFRPPPVMPFGNVGTPSMHFKALIRTCQLPGSVMKKLGLEFPKGRGKKRFSQVPFNYGTGVVEANQACSDDDKIAFTAAGHLIPSSADFSRISKPKKKQVSKAPKLELVDEKEDGAEVEEWERYESFHNDVTSQDRTKERLYEKEIELVWEKGGPGLVFYTDAQFWREKEGDFDEQTADEWDVDMSVYYGEGVGDLDAQDSISMLHSDKLKTGKLTESAFKTTARHMRGKTKMKEDVLPPVKKRRIGPAAPPPIGEFEAHTRGFGRRLMEAQGWQDGQGLGRDAEGLPYALDNDGQHPYNKKGFGYYGEKLQGWGSSSTTTHEQHQPWQIPQKSRKHFISTIFDHPQDVDPIVSPLRTHEPTTLSHRHSRISFTKAAES